MRAIGELVADVRDHRGGDAHADPGGERDGVDERGHGAQPPSGVATTQAISIAAASPSMPLIPGMLGDPVGEDDVEREERGVGEGERHPDGLGGELDVGEQVHAAHGEDERRPLRERPRADRREHDHRQELDRRHGPERGSRSIEM